MVFMLIIAYEPFPQKFGEGNHLNKTMMLQSCFERFGQHENLTGKVCSSRVNKAVFVCMHYHRLSVPLNVTQAFAFKPLQGKDGKEACSEMEI